MIVICAGLVEIVGSGMFGGSRKTGPALTAAAVSEMRTVFLCLLFPTRAQ